MQRSVECVPNFSEGRNEEVIEAITSAMKQAGAVVLDVDMGAATNRTVVTMAGEPADVLEAAFQAIAVATELIDMRHHRGEHPRLGATDVCPFVPVQGVDMRDCVELAERLGRRVGEELGIPVYLYGEAARSARRRNLADIRQGEYEGLESKLADPVWAPDFGPATFVPKTGAVVIGAREFLIAYNINLNTRNKVLASRIAFRLREQGGLARDTTGSPLRGPDGKGIKVPGLFKDLRAVGWYIEEYGIAQVSMNVLNFRKTPLHEVYEAACALADEFGVRVTGSEIVGLIPKGALLAAGGYYMARQGLCPGAPERELVHIAVKSLGLNDVKPFDPDEKVIEYRLAKEMPAPMVASPIRDFVDVVSSDAPVPGGGSVAALCGSLASALCAMVSSLTYKQKGLEDRREVMDKLATEAQSSKQRLLACVEEDSRAFERMMAARRIKARTDEERKARQRAVEEATMGAARVPLSVLRECLQVARLAERLSEEGYDACVSDAGTAAAVVLAAAEGAFLNVLINAAALGDSRARKELESEGTRLLEGVRRSAANALEVARRKSRGEQ